MPPDQSTEWAQRLQRPATDALDRLLSVLLDARQLVAALPGVAPQEVAAQLSRHWQERGPADYQQLADGGLRYWACLTLVSAGYGTEWLSATLPPHRLAELGPPPALPFVPDGAVGKSLHPAWVAADGGPDIVADSLQWSGWYVQCAAWSAQQQAWTGRAYLALRDEIAAGTIGQQGIRTSAQRFLQDRLADYLGEVAELGLDLVSDALSVGEGSVHTLSTELLGRPPSDDLTVVIAGAAGKSSSAELAVENNRSAPADVVCAARPTAGWSLTVYPERFHLAAGQTRRITITVMFPDTAVVEPALAGRVSISGHEDVPQTVRVQAVASAPQRAIKVRALHPPTVGDTNGDPG